MATRAPRPLDDALIAAVTERLARGQQVRRTLPPDGRVHIDRQLPFLVLYRPPASGIDPGLRAMIRAQASYLVAPTDPASRRLVPKLVSSVVETLADNFGAFLVIELWDAPDGEEATRPAFVVHAAQSQADGPSVSALVRGLGKVRNLGQSAHVDLVGTGPVGPPGHRRILGVAQCEASHVHLVGVAARPVWRDPDTGEPFPLIRRALARQVSQALLQCAFEFARAETTHRPLHYHALGRQAVVRAVKTVDAQLAAVAEGFDLLLTITPTNAEHAYRAFRRAKRNKPPRFQYRPHPIDPALLKRKLFDIKIERVEDPTLEFLFREKRRELELKLSLVGDRQTPRFLHTSLALYGAVSDEIVGLANTLCTDLPEDRPARQRLSGAEFATIAEVELREYRNSGNGIEPRVELRDDVSSLMVSGGSLLVGSAMAIPARRVNALLQHEVGTHVVTYWNGRAQPLRLLASGLAGHDELQEGLAVFAEYLVGGLTAGRLRTLAGRVLAARAVVDGADFIDTYRLLADDVGLADRQAFLVAMRVHRGGGFVKDAVYLRGLRAVTAYVAQGGRIDTLLVGKMAVEHTAVIEELQRRQVLVQPPLRPRFLSDPDAHYRIERVRSGLDLVDLVDGG